MSELIIFSSKAGGQGLITGTELRCTIWSLQFCLYHINNIFHCKGIVHCNLDYGRNTLYLKLNILPREPTLFFNHYILENNLQIPAALNLFLLRKTLMSRQTCLKLIFFFSRCSVDPYLFENFLTEDGDLLRAKFKAFKFPETNFVLFRGVVNVCLDKCTGVSFRQKTLGIVSQPIFALRECS